MQLKSLVSYSFDEHEISMKTCFNFIVKNSAWYVLILVPSEPVQIVVVDNASLTTVPNAGKHLRGGGDDCTMCLVIFLVLIILGLLIGMIVAFATGNSTGGFIVLGLFLAACCGGGGTAAAKK